MQASNPSVSAETQPHFLDYWRIIRIRKTVIIAVWLLVLIATALVTAALKPTYMSRVQIAVKKDVKDINPIGVVQRDPGYDPYFVNTEFKKIQSTSVLYPVLRDPKLRLIEKWSERLGLKSGERLTLQQAYRYLLNNLEVSQVRNTSLIEIKVFSPDTQEAAEVANAIAKAYRDWREQVRLERVTNGIAALRKRLDEQTKKVEELQAEVDQLRIKYMIPDVVVNSSVSYQASPERERVSSLAQELTRAEAEYVNYKSKLDKLAGLKGDELREAILTVLPYETLLPQLMSSLVTVEQNLARIEPDLGPEHPDYKKTLALKQKIEEQIKRRVAGILEGLRANMTAAKDRYDMLNDALEKGKQEVALQADKWREYFLKKRDLENKKRVRDAILLRTLQEEVDAYIPTESTVQIITAAEPSLVPVRPKLTLNLALGGIFGLIMGVGLAFFIEYLDTSVKTIDDVERTLGATVLGVIPQNVGLLIEEGPDGPHAEAYRVLRTNILFSRKDPAANAIGVVSGGAGEGKSTTIFNLATAFAQSGDRVLIVDSDLRRPAIHKFLGVSNRVGLTNYLLGQNSLEEVIQTTPLSTMDFLPSGKLPNTALGVLNSERMREFVKDVKGRYDFVFFDSPPIMGVSDAVIIARMVDLTLMVVQYRKYPMVMTIRAKNMVEKVGATLVGIVLNNINISQDSYYYYYSGYYYDYYSRYEGDQKPKSKSKKRRRSRSKRSSSRAKEAETEEPAAVAAATEESQEGEEESGQEGLTQKF